MEELFQAVDLGFYLIALQRPQEALEVVSFLAANVKFEGNFNIWTPVGNGICLQARLLRLSGSHQAARNTMERIRVHPFQVDETKEQVTKKIDTLQSKIDEAYQRTSKKWACHVLARTLYQACFYQEAAFYDLASVEAVDVERLQMLILSGFGKLRDRLQ